MSDRPEWLVPGADVAEISYGTGSGERVLLTSILRVGKRDVVLENGHRYNVARLRRDTDTWGPTYELLPAADPRVVRVLAEQRRRDVASRVGRLIDTWRATPPGERTDEPLVRARDLLDSILKNDDRAGGAP